MQKNQIFEHGHLINRHKKETEDVHLALIT